LCQQLYQNRRIRPAVEKSSMTSRTGVTHVQ
jgi:hypothetical protein